MLGRIAGDPGIELCNVLPFGHQSGVRLRSMPARPICPRSRLMPPFEENRFEVDRRRTCCCCAPHRLVQRIEDVLVQQNQIIEHLSPEQPAVQIDRAHCGLMHSKRRKFLGNICHPCVDAKPCPEFEVARHYQCRIEIAKSSKCLAMDHHRAWFAKNIEAKIAQRPLLTTLRWNNSLRRQRGNQSKIVDVAFVQMRSDRVLKHNCAFTYYEEKTHSAWRDEAFEARRVKSVVLEQELDPFAMGHVDASIPVRHQPQIV